RERIETRQPADRLSPPGCVPLLRRLDLGAFLLGSTVRYTSLARFHLRTCHPIRRHLGGICRLGCRRWLGAEMDRQDLVAVPSVYGIDSDGSQKVLDTDVRVGVW